MKNYALIIISALVGTQSWALVQRESFVVPPSKILAPLLQKVESGYDARAKNNEHNIMNEVLTEYLTKVHPGEVFRADNYRKGPTSIENSDLTQSWRDEVAVALDGFTVPKVIYLDGKEDYYHHFYQNSNIARAKRIARLKMYEAIQNNWPKLKDTDFNEQGLDCKNAKKCEGFDDVVLRTKMPQSFFYSYDLSSKRSSDYIFEFQGVGYVEVSKNLKTGRVVFGLAYLNDNNRPEPGLEKLQTDVDAGHPPPPKPAESAVPDSPSKQ